MSDSESFSPTPLNTIPPTVPPRLEVVHILGSESPDDYNTTPTASEEERQDNHKRVTRPEPNHPELDFVNIDMDWASSINEAGL